MPSCLCYTGHLKILSAPLPGDQMAGIPPAGLTGRPQYVRAPPTLGTAASAHPSLGTAIRQGEGPSPPPPRTTPIRPCTGPSPGSGARSVSSLRDRRPLLLHLLVWRTVINNLVFVKCVRILTVLGIPDAIILLFYIVVPRILPGSRANFDIQYYRNYCEHILLF